MPACRQDVAKYTMRQAPEYIKQKLLEFYKNNIPDYVVDAGKIYITFRVKEDAFSAARDHVITICEVQGYFLAREEDREILKLGDITGDPSYLDKLAFECLEWVKFMSSA